MNALFLQATERVCSWIVTAAVKISTYLGLKDEIILRQRVIAKRSIQNGDLDQAEMCLRTVLRLEPGDRATHVQLAYIFREKKFHELANSIIEQSVAQGDTRAESLEINEIQTMIQIYTNLSDIKNSWKWFEVLRNRIDPASPLLDHWAGFIYLHDNKPDQAAARLRTALEKAPQDSDSMNLLATILVAQNRKEEAVQLIERALEIAPDDAWLYSQLVALKYYKSPDHPHIIHMTNLVELEDLPRPARRRLHFMLGQGFNDLKMYDLAFHHMRSGNELEYQHKDISGLVEFVDLTIKGFDREALATMAAYNRAPATRTPVFIVGMPRSGSTLVEQILGSHPSVQTCGESGAIPDLAETLALEQGGRYPECLLSLTGDSIEKTAREYLDEIGGQADKTKSVYVDKQLFNKFNLGLIFILFPNAKIIHCKRDAIDTCLSCYFQHFLSLIWMEDLKTIGLVYRQYERMMAHWHAVLPIEMLEVQYESLVADPELWTRRILDYCGLPWNDECLHFDRNPRIAWTASQYQVKSPIYATSVERWRNYEKHLGDLVELFHIRDADSNGKPGGPPGLPASPASAAWAGAVEVHCANG